MSNLYHHIVTTRYNTQLLVGMRKCQIIHSSHMCVNLIENSNPETNIFKNSSKIQHIYINQQMNYQPLNVDVGHFFQNIGRFELCA